MSHGWCERSEGFQVRAKQSAIVAAAVIVVIVDIVQIFGNRVNDLRRKNAKDKLDDFNGVVEFVGRKIKLAGTSEKNCQRNAVHEKIRRNVGLPGRIVLARLFGGWNRNSELRR